MSAHRCQRFLDLEFRDEWSFKSAETFLGRKLWDFCSDEQIRMKGSFGLIKRSPSVVKDLVLVLLGVKGGSGSFIKEGFIISFI